MPKTPKTAPKNPPKTRIDTALLARGMVENLARAQALIMAGVVYADTKKIAKASEMIAENIPLRIKGQDHPYVSRGGLKLAHGLSHFALNVTGAIACDVGASTGGFTDVLLRNGAARVYAVDVGNGQLAWSLRTDDRVILRDKTNARFLDNSLIPEPLDIVVCDASFIRLQQVLPAALALIKPGGHLVALIKPQFELPRHLVGEGGVVRDSVLHQQVCDDTAAWLNSLPGWHVLGIEASPITGPEGNREFLIAASKTNNPTA